MGSSLGRRFRITLFGEGGRHQLGAVLEGAEQGLSVDFQRVSAAVSRYFTLRGKYAAGLKDLPGTVRVVSGVQEGCTTGTPITLLADNMNVEKQSQELVLEPGGPQFISLARYGEISSTGGMGHLSHSLQIPLVAAGEVARQLLAERYSVLVGSHFASVGRVRDRRFDPVQLELDLLEKLSYRSLPLIRPGGEQLVEEEISAAAHKGETVGCTVECAVLNLRAGVGSPLFDGVESCISRALFALPTVRGVEFGDGFPMAEKWGTQTADAYCESGGSIRTYTNCQGGLSYGVTNGMPVVFRCAVAPMGRPRARMSVLDYLTREESERGGDVYYNPCAALCALPLVEALTCITLLDLLQE
jgi:chorismate synthase